MKHLFFTMIAAAMISTSSQAQEIDRRRENQQDRIAQGLASGELTEKEAARLDHREANLNRTIRADRMSGGGLSARERLQIERRQNQLSKDIRKQKHDAQKR